MNFTDFPITHTSLPIDWRK